LGSACAVGETPRLQNTVGGGFSESCLPTFQKESSLKI